MRTFDFEDWRVAERKRNDERAARLRENANPDCPVCRGRGQVSGYVAPSKTADYACYCTGEADWQRGEGL